MISSVIYAIDYLKLVLWLLPDYLRQANMVAWLNVATSPVLNIYKQFLQFRKNKLYELSITPQVCRMEALLNDRYDFTQRRIFIDDAKEFPPVYLFKDAELKPVDLFKHSEAQSKFLFTDGESATITDDFIVYVPVTISFDMVEMISLVNKFKLPGMKFKIQTF
jgi:hypothetical protein